MVPAPGRPTGKAACRTVPPASAGKAAPAPAAGMPARMAHASAAGAAHTSASAACTAHTDHLHVIVPPDPLRPGGICFKVIFHKLIVKLEFVEGSEPRATLSFRTSPKTGVGISIEFQAAYRHPFVGAVIDRPRKRTEFQQKFPSNGTFSPKKYEYGNFPAGRSMSAPTEYDDRHSKI